MNTSSTNNAHSVLGTVVATLAAYLACSIAIMFFAIQLWMPSNISDARALSELAETSIPLQIVQIFAGTGLGMMAGLAACRFSGGRIVAALWVGVMLTLYGLISIQLHPLHPLPMQVAKVVSPLPLAILGALVQTVLNRRACFK